MNNPTQPTREEICDRKIPDEDMGTLRCGGTYEKVCDIPFGIGTVPLLQCDNCMKIRV